MKLTKSQRAAAEKFDAATLYAPLEAFKIVKEVSSVKFDETVEAHFRLGIDTRQANQQLRGMVALPNGSGKQVRVAVFAEGAQADAAVELAIPVSGGNVSFYNQTGEEPILPTPVVGVLGVIDDVHKAIGNELGTVGEKEVLIALGETKDEFGGSIWQQVSADTSEASSLNGLPPQVDMANEKRLAGRIRQDLPGRRLRP